MPITHAVVQLNHEGATVQEFGAKGVTARTIRSHSHPTRQHNSDVRAVHEFFGEVCDAVSAEVEILVVGSQTALSDFKHYVLKHRPQLEPRIAGWERVDHPTDAQVVALARKFFDHYDRLKGTRPVGF